MISEIIMPDVGPIKEEPKIIKWLKTEGDDVRKGEVLLEVETTKAILEIESTHSGVLRRMFFQEGESVAPLTVIALLGDREEEIPEIDPYHRYKRIPAAERKPTSQVAEPIADQTSRRIRASPLAKKLARERGVDLASIVGSGPGGRITKDDVLRTSAHPGSEQAVDGFLPYSRIRARIASTVQKSFASIPHIYVVQDIDMERARAIRKASSEEPDLGKISYDGLFIKAVALSLKEFPVFNAIVQDEGVKLLPRANVGFVVETQDGIIVPVVRDADTKSLTEISAEISSLAEKARGKKLPARALSGSGFTISNLGMHGVVGFSAIIYPPQTGILAIGSVRQVPYVANNEIALGWRVRVTLSSDHRAVDGAVAARFLNSIGDKLEDPEVL